MKKPASLKPMETAPRNATWIALWYKDKYGNVWPVAAHWAQGGGDDQPPFRGWFAGHGSETRDGWHQISDGAIGWTTIEGEPLRGEGHEHLAELRARHK